MFKEATKARNTALAVTQTTLAKAENNHNDGKRCQGMAKLPEDDIAAKSTKVFY